jgi:hypothetical protein
MTQPGQFSVSPPDQFSMSFDSGERHRQRTVRSARRIGRFAPAEEISPRSARRTKMAIAEKRGGPEETGARRVSRERRSTGEEVGRIHHLAFFAQHSRSCRFAADA